MIRHQKVRSCSLNLTFVFCMETRSMQKVDVKKGEGCELGVREERALRSSAAPQPGQSWGLGSDHLGF